MTALDVRRGRYAPAGYVLLCCALLAGTALASRGMTQEAAVSLHGDMPRHLMNGVFLRDFLAEPSFTPQGVLTYAQHYFARYPALSLGHHPPLLPVALVPAYAVMGVSVFAARVVIVGFFLTSIWLCFTLVRRCYDARVAGWAAVLFATSPFAVTYGQIVMSEMPAMTFVLAAFNALVKFRDTARLRYYLAFVAFAALSLSAKQLAAFVAPAYLVFLMADGGWARLKQPHVVVWTMAGLGLMVVAAFATLVLSPFNVQVVVDVLTSGIGLSSWQTIVAQIWRQHLTPSLGLLAALGLVMSIVSRDRRATGAVVWALSVLWAVLLLTGPYDAARYAIYGLPAYCMLGASVIANVHRPSAAIVATTVLVAAVGAQTVRASTVRPVGASGYELAAQLVLSDSDAPTVLYSASIDSGYFVFFVRKHDAARRLVVLRSDKLLTTSFMGDVSAEERISSRQDIYDRLRTFGTKYVVLEDRPSGSRVLDWLREECRTDRFIERARFPIDTTDFRLRGTDLVVYEYRDASPAASDAELDLRLPLVGREIKIPLSDLVGTGR